MVTFLVMVQLMDQYLVGGVVPTRADLDQVFLRFGKRKFQPSDERVLELEDK
jgi:hypothetical protein